MCCNRDEHIYGTSKDTVSTDAAGAVTRLKPKQGADGVVFGAWCEPSRKLFVSRRIREVSLTIVAE